MSVSISWLWYMFARCHHQGEMCRGYTGSLSLLFSYDYIRLHNYLNRKYLIKKKKRFQPEKKWIPEARAWSPRKGLSRRWQVSERVSGVREEVVLGVQARAGFQSRWNHKWTALVSLALDGNTAALRFKATKFLQASSWYFSYGHTFKQGFWQLVILGDKFLRALSSCSMTLLPSWSLLCSRKAGPMSPREEV